MLKHAYNVGMSNVQYTIRKIPSSLDKRLRRQAKESGLSLNKLVIEYITTASQQQSQQDEDFSWLIGSNTIDDNSLQAIAELDKIDKQKDHSKW